MIYFISDLHFGDKGIIKYERKQFETVEEHDNHIVEKINKTVKVTDELWVLGDIGNPEKVKFLNGRKYLILGNHDKRPIKEYEGYFAKVYSTPQFFNKRVLLSHYPFTVPDGYINLHGHLHGSYLDSHQYLNLSIDICNYKPVSEKEIDILIGNLPKTKTKFLEEWYAPHYYFTDDREHEWVVNGKIDLEATETIRRRKSTIIFVDDLAQVVFHYYPYKEGYELSFRVKTEDGIAHDSIDIPYWGYEEHKRAQRIALGKSNERDWNWILELIEFHLKGGKWLTDRMIISKNFESEN